MALCKGNETDQQCNFLQQVGGYFIRDKGVPGTCQKTYSRGATEKDLTRGENVELGWDLGSIEVSKEKSLVVTLDMSGR